MHAGANTDCMTKAFPVLSVAVTILLYLPLHAPKRLGLFHGSLMCFYQLNLKVMG